MTQTDKLVETTQFKVSQDHWNNLIKLGENICVVFSYLNDRQFRVFQWAQSLDSSNFLPLNLSFSERSFDEAGDLDQYLISQLPPNWQTDNLSSSLNKADKHIVLIIADGESLLKPENYNSLSLLQSLLISNRDKISSFIAFESDVYSSVPSMSAHNLLFQNILYFPLYPDQDIALFINYLCHKWDLKMPSPTRKSIVSFSGGSFWLTKEACRQFRDTHVWDPNNHHVQFRLSQIAKVLTETDSLILTSLPHTKSNQHLAEYSHLKNLGYITQTHKLRIPALLPYLKTQIQPISSLELKKDEIFFHNVPITRVFSITEFSLLKLFLSFPNTPISRDKIAKVIWPNQTEDHYSPWAIDQAIKRLRDRLISLKLPPSIISSVRGVGYEYRT